MRKKIEYALLTCFIAYLIAAAATFLFSITQSGWSQIGGNNTTFMMSLTTLGLSDYPFWGDFWYLAVLVPWLGSSLALALLLIRPARTAGRRWQWSGLSVALYYIVILLILGIGKLIAFWGNIEVHPGDFIYALLIVWPIGGYVLGYISATITDKIIKLPAAV